MKYWLSDGGLGILGVMRCHPVHGADQGNLSPGSGQCFGPVGDGYISGGDGETVWISSTPPWVVG